MTSKVLLTCLSACVAALLTGAGAWLVFGANRATEADIAKLEADLAAAELRMKDYTDTQAPWLKERGVVLANQEMHSAELDKVEKNLGTMLQAQQELIIELRVLGTKFEDYLAGSAGSTRSPR